MKRKKMPMQKKVELVGEVVRVLCGQLGLDFIVGVAGSGSLWGTFNVADSETTGPAKADELSEVMKYIMLDDARGIKAMLEQAGYVVYGPGGGSN